MAGDAPKTIALIPARGGSKGLPGKNIRPLLGKPMIAYSIEAALACPLIDGVYVSTDDEAIADVARQYGAEVPFMRPPELATDTATSQDAVVHFMDWFVAQHGQPADTLVLLQPTSPGRSVTDLTEAMLHFNQQPVGTSVVSVQPSKPVQWQGTLDAQDRLMFHQLATTPESGADMTQNRQALNKTAPQVALNGAIYIAPWQRAYAGQFLSQPLSGFLMTPEASVDVDTLLDFEWAELVMSKYALAPLKSPQPVVVPHAHLV